ncbi:ATP-binding protein [Streptomyces sp. NBC_00519]|uniref:ATP-binding protein n=1 Tax=Streptomyces sp. NBC_00519 TaxID=2975764 RepID=UPI0030DF80F7
MTAQRATGSGLPSYAENHPRTEGTAAQARRLVRAAFGLWDLDHLTERGELVITELVANAVRHTSCPQVRLIVSRPYPEWVRLAVVDRAPRKLPRLRQACADDPTGRGLVLVDAYSNRWGYDLIGRTPGAPWGKAVWSELGSPNSDPRRHRHRIT